MLGSDRQRLSAGAIRELEALDAALRGEIVEGEHASTVELVRAMRAVKPAPSEQAALALDTRAMHAFEPKPRRTTRHSRALRVVLAHPTAAATALVVTALAVAVPLAFTGDTHPSSGAASSAPAVRALPQIPGPFAAQGRPAAPAAHGLAARQAAPFSRIQRSSAAPLRSGSAESAAPAQSARQVERAATLNVGVASNAIQSTAQRVFALASAFHGYVQQSSVSSGGGNPSGGSNEPPVQPVQTTNTGQGEDGGLSEQGGASFQLRIPSSSLGAALAALAQLGHVRSETDTTNDVTGEVDALHKSLRDAEAQRSSLLGQLARASSVESEEALKRRLQAVERRISGLHQALDGVNSRVQYTNVALSLTPEAHRSEDGGYLTVGGALHDGGRILAAALAVLVLVGTALFPVALMGLAGWALVSATRRRLREQALDRSSQ